MENLFNKITDTSHILTGKVPPPSPVIPRAKLSEENDNAAEDTTSDKVTKDDKLNGNDDKLSLKTTSAQRRSSFKKSLSTADDVNGNKANCNRDQDAFLNKLNSIVRTKDSLLKTATNNVKPQQYEARCYIDKDRNINFGKMITDEVLAADYKLIEKAKKDVSQMECLNSVQSSFTYFHIFFADKCSRNNCADCRHTQNSADCGECWRFTWRNVRWQRECHTTVI